MNGQERELIDETAFWIRQRAGEAEGSHDYFHIARVASLAGNLANSFPHVDMVVVLLAAWLHDVADAKFHNGDEEIGPRTARSWLESRRAEAHAWLEPTRIEAVVFIVANLSFRHLLERKGSATNFETRLRALGISDEFGIVHDADKLDAIGAIGIARCFAYGGHKGRALYDPADSPKDNLTKDGYAGSQSASLNHFYEKLFKLRELMRTEAGRKVAADRHAYMETFVNRFLGEWEGLL